MQAKKSSSKTIRVMVNVEELIMSLLILFVGLVGYVVRERIGNKEDRGLTGGQFLISIILLILLGIIGIIDSFFVTADPL